MKIETIIINDNDYAKFLQIKKVRLFAVVGENELEEDFIFTKQEDPREFIYSNWKEAKGKLTELQKELQDFYEQI